MLWSAPIDTRRAISPTTAFLMSSMLSDVVSGGTATGARAAGFTLPAGGKTGTTDDYADAWFVGYTPHLVAGVWFGLDTPAPIMNRGFAGVVAVPAWARFMKAATTNGAKPDWYAGAGRRREGRHLPVSAARAPPSAAGMHVQWRRSFAPDRRGRLWPLARPAVPLPANARGWQRPTSTRTSFRSGRPGGARARCTMRRQMR